MISTSLHGPYRLAKRPTLFLPDDPVQPYACQIVRLKEADYCLGTIWADSGISYISDPLPVAFTQHGIISTTSLSPTQ